jgi:hypothetical protein
MNIAGHTSMQENEVSIQVSIWLDLEIRNEFEFEIQTTQHLYFIQDMQIHGVVLLKYCSSYSDTRSVTTLPSPPNKNVDPRFGRRKGSNMDNEQSHIPSLR